MNDVLGWFVIAFVLLAGPAIIITVLVRTMSRTPIEQKYRGFGAASGVLGGFDAVWSPQAHEASSERDRQRRASVPAPTPDRGPGRFDEDAHRITIEIR